MNDHELYTTTTEQDAHDLAGELRERPHQVRCYVLPKRDKQGRELYVVVVHAPDALERAREVKQAMFGS